MSAVSPVWRADVEAWWDGACLRALPQALVDATGCDLPRAHEIGTDVAARGRAFAGCGPAARVALAAPFAEEAAVPGDDGQGLAARAASVVVVRNSLLERERHAGVLFERQVADAAAVLARLLDLLLLTGPEPDDAGRLDGPFTGLQSRFPRAWGALVTLAHVLGRGGGRARYQIQFRTIAAPGVPVPPRPGESALDDAEYVPHPCPPAGADGLSGWMLLPPESERRGGAWRPVPGASADLPGAVVPGPSAGGGLDPVFDPWLVRGLGEIAAGRSEMLVVPALSVVSRRFDKLLRVVETVLAHGGCVLTTNYLLLRDEVHVRSGSLVRPALRNQAACFADRQGLSEVHTWYATSALAAFARRS